MSTWVWLIIIIAIILLVWWLISRNAQMEDTDIQIDYIEESKEVEMSLETETPKITEEPVPTKPDDLTILEGIGPKVNSLLHEAGIATFAQLASTDVSKLNEILNANSLQMMDPTSWPKQAGLAALGKQDELHALQEKLKGGRAI